jgi:hypothetical protein
MKHLLIVLAIAGALTSCNSGSETEKDPVDSLEQRKDTLVKKADSTFDAKIDSLKQRKEELKDRFDSSIEAKKDSVKQNNK